MFLCSNFHSIYFALLFKKLLCSVFISLLVIENVYCGARILMWHLKLDIFQSGFQVHISKTCVTCVYSLFFVCIYTTVCYISSQQSMLLAVYMVPLFINCCRLENKSKYNIKRHQTFIRSLLQNNKPSVGQRTSYGFSAITMAFNAT